MKKMFFNGYMDICSVQSGRNEIYEIYDLIKSDLHFAIHILPEIRKHYKCPSQLLIILYNMAPALPT
jgi:hypothetical protein